MFFLGLFHKNAKLNRTGKFIVDIQNKTIPKWMTIVSEKGSLELLRLLALGLTDPRYLSRLSFDMQKLVKASEPYVHLETLIVHHPEINGNKTREGYSVNAIEIDAAGKLSKVPGKKIEYFSTISSRSRMGGSTDLCRHFLLAYGPKFDHHCGTDNFDFDDPFMRLNRIKNVFDAKAHLTDPTAFLSNLAHRARYKRLAPMAIIRLLSVLGNQWTDLHTSSWLDKDHDFEKERVFVQQYRPVHGGPKPMMDGFFDDKADERIDELIGICFTQNMKSMEKYYRWLSRLYVETFGKLHMNLVNTIFKYNDRFRKGAYIATLAGTRKRPWG